MYKMRMKVRKYGSKMREITPKWCIDLIYDVGHAKLLKKFLASNFWKQIPDFTTRLISWPVNKNQPFGVKFILYMKTNSGKRRNEFARIKLYFFGGGFQQTKWGNMSTKSTIWERIFLVCHRALRICLDKTWFLRDVFWFPIFINSLESSTYATYTNDFSNSRSVQPHFSQMFIKLKSVLSS